ncbi:hypothetical protein [Prochlorococcus marinus]|uniref:hypothetical protein n=1 Tax=Prochlorococcus marinus TaxID=1219 RepID=UPI0022B384B9|nr:hypothetical protein [Prochlorococcus marinus]
MTSLINKRSSKSNVFNMHKKFNLGLIIGLGLFCLPSHSKEIPKHQEDLSSIVEDVAEEMNSLNKNLNLLSASLSRFLAN